MKDNDDFDFWQWSANDYITAKPFKTYLLEIKKRILGLPVTGIYTMGCIFNNEDDDVWGAEGCLELDEPIVIDIDGLHLDICFHNTSHAKIGLNTLTMKEKSYQGCTWRNVSHRFSQTIGHKVKDIVLKTNNEGFYDSVFMGDGNRPDGGDYFDQLFMVLDNGYVLELCGSYEYMWIIQKEFDSLTLFPSDQRVFIGDRFSKTNWIDYLSLIPKQQGISDENEAFNIFADDCEALELAINSVNPEFDIYRSSCLSISEWERILSVWHLLCEADRFDKVFEKLCSIDYAEHKVGDSGMLNLMNHSAARIWKQRDSEWHIFDNFRLWFDKQRSKCTHIHVQGN